MKNGANKPRDKSGYYHFLLRARYFGGGGRQVALNEFYAQGEVIKKIGEDWSARRDTGLIVVSHSYRTTNDNQEWTSGEHFHVVYWHYKSCGITNELTRLGDTLQWFYRWTPVKDPKGLVKYLQQV